MCGGALLSKELQEHRRQVFPVDSEHSAIFQCLQGIDRERELRRIILTASGGPFRTFTKEQLANVTVEQALAHPTWNMGKNVTIGSATLANKGLEVIEASCLFGLGADDIDVLIHPQSLVHSLIETVDGALLAQLGTADMRLPIQYALTWPHRLPSPVRRLELSELLTMRFELPDPERGSRRSAWPTTRCAPAARPRPCTTPRTRRRWRCFCRKRSPTSTSPAPLRAL